MRLLSVLPIAIPFGQKYIGPLDPQAKVKRDQYLLRDNETISVDDRVFGKSIKTETQKETQEMVDPRKLISKYEDMIDDHIERRVAVIFQQLVVCYKTGLHFEIGDTRHQGESATALQLIDHNGEKSKLCVRNAAHSSTIPCIIAYENIEWKKHVIERAPKPQGFVYIKGASIYNAANSTLAMHRDINEADIKIDAHLRKYTLELLNKCSQGDTEPINAFKIFLEKAIEETKSKEKAAKTIGIVTALEFFEVSLEGIVDELKEDPKFFEKMLGIQIDENKTSARVRREIYNLRYKAIRDHQLDEAKIIAKVEGVAQKILEKIGKVRKPIYFKKALFCLLREEIPTDKDRLRLDKLFSSAQGYYYSETTKTANTLSSTKALLKKEVLDEIKALAQYFAKEMQNMKLDETLKRGLITRTLRGIKDWTQKELAQKIKEMFPTTAASQSTISRIENNGKRVGVGYAQELAEVFAVDVALFVFSFFND